MLAPDDRSVLLDLLRPPPGSTLDVAVATTFTLDLEAALVAPLAFAAFDAVGPGDPVATLEAIRSVASRVTVFCQAGELRVPARTSDLFSFLEPVVHPVRRPRPGFLFHPKLWLLRFNGDDGESLRLIVPTRNLTNDASWDAVLRLDGVAGGGPKALNRPLADLVRWCAHNTVGPFPGERAKALESLTESVRRAEWEFPDGVSELTFHALGLERRVVPDFSGRRHLVISPFLNDAGVELTGHSDNVVLVSRPDQLDLLDPHLLDSLDCRSVASMGAAAVDEPNEGESEAGDSAEALGDLHAKIFIAERGRRAHVFVGSANATGAAFGGNVEILVELIGGPKKLGIDAVLDDLGSILEPCSVEGGREPGEREELRRRLDDLLRSAAVLELRLTPQATDEGLFAVGVEASAPLVQPDDGVVATVELLSRPGYAVSVDGDSTQIGPFEDVPLADITPFVVLRIELQGESETLVGGTVLRGSLVGDPAGRLDAVIARQVDTPAKFLRFLFLLLSMAGGTLPPWLRAAVSDEDGSSAADERRLLDLGVFEAVARGLASHPEVLDDLGRLVDRLRATDDGRAVLPDGFDALWAAVSNAREAIR